MSLFSRPLSLALYSAAARAATPLAPAILRLRSARGKEDRTRLGERLGRASLPRPAGSLVWLHAVSVGESLSLLPLIARLRRERPDLALLVTTGTQTSAQVMARRAPDGILHQYAPVDAPAAVKRFLDHWQPQAAFFAESELWPNLLLGARERGVRLALVSARITERTVRGWSRDRGAARALLGSFSLVLAQDGVSAERLARLGAHVQGRLNLKLLADAPPADEAALADLRTAVAGRPIVVAASTHAGEEALVIEAVGRLAERPLLIIAPRHPERGGAIAEAGRAAGLGTVRRGAGGPLDAGVQLYVADTLGEMGLFLRLADVAVMGGGFAGGVGGHNPLEPARIGVPVIAGPDTANFTEVYADLLAAGGAVIARDAAELAAALGRLLGDADARADMAKAAREVAARSADGLERAWPAIASILPRP